MNIGPRFLLSHRALPSPSFPDPTRPSRGLAVPGKMIPKWKVPNWVAGTALFALSFIHIYWIAGDILQIAGDEGIYLQGGRLVALGQQPYRDFVAITGPLTFWIQGALAAAGGMSLAVMRLAPVFDAAFLAWAVYWLTSRYAGAFYSVGTAVAFLAYEARLRQLNVNHRWDSAALAVAAALLAGRALRPGRSGLSWTASGFLIAAAAFATPSMLVVALPLLFFSARQNLRSAMGFLAGGTLATGIAAIYLQQTHTLAPMIQAMLWTSANYAQANRVFYGGILMTGPAGLQGAGALYFVGWLWTLIPAILPLVALAGWGWYLRRKENQPDSVGIPLLLSVAVALVFSAWPRWTSDALLHTLAVSWFLCALLLYRLTAPRQRLWFCGVALLAAGASLGGQAFSAMDDVPRDTRVGILRAAGDQSEFLAGLERWIQPGDSLFSYPYFASAYYFLNARNPTRYSFLQPGMMTLEDERRAVDELRAAPPRWVIFEDYPPEVVLSIWPGSDPARIPMLEMTAYLHQHYRPVDTSSGHWGHLVVLTRNAE